MSLIDCIEGRKLVPSDKLSEVKADLESRIENYMKDPNITKTEAEIRVKNDFINEQYSSLNDELNNIKKEADVKPKAISSVDNSGIDNVVKSYNEKVAEPIDIPKTEETPKVEEPKEDINNYDKTDEVKKNIEDGTYEKQVRDGDLSKTQLAKILKESGYKKEIGDEIIFRANNKDLIDSLDKAIPDGVDISYLRSNIREAIKDGRFAKAVSDGVLDSSKAKDILKYFNVKPNKEMQQAFEEGANKLQSNLEATPSTAPLSDTDMAFINTLKANVDSLKPSGYTNGIKDMLDTEDYAGIMDLMKSQFVDQTSTAKKLFDNEDVYDKFLKAVNVEDGSSNADELLKAHDIYEPEVSQEDQKPAVEDKYVTYKGKDENGNLTDLPAKVIENNGFTSLLETPDGRQFDNITDRLTPGNKDNFDALKPKEPKIVSQDNGMFGTGDQVVYGYDKNIFTIDHTLTIPNDKGVNELYYQTTEGPIIKASGITGLGRNTNVDNIIQKEYAHSKRGRVLERIAKRFTQLFPDIKYHIGAYDFDAPARFNKGLVEINIGYGDKGYTRDEINRLEATDPLSVPWLKRESVAHEYMHPFLLALKHSNTELYNNLTKELIATQPDILAHVDKLISSGSYNASERLDEGLAIYLGNSITKAFTKSGTLNTDYVEERSKSFIGKFIDWLHDMMDYLSGKRKPISLDDFVKAANNDNEAQRGIIRDIIKSDPALKELYSKEHNNDLTKTINYIKRVGADAYNKDFSINDDKYDSAVQKVADDINSKTEGSSDNTKLKAVVYSKATMDSGPIYKVIVNGKERFITREEEFNSSATSWNEVIKNEHGDWTDTKGEVGALSGTYLGDTKEEALNKLNQESSTNNPVSPKVVDDLVAAVGRLNRSRDNGVFEFIKEDSDVHDVKFDQSDPKNIKVYVDSHFMDDSTAPSTLIRYGEQNIEDPNLRKEFTNLVQRNYYKTGSPTDVEQKMSVNSLSPFMKMQDVSDFMVKQLGDQSTTINYSDSEFDAINQLEAYMELNKDNSASLREKIMQKLKHLDETATTRLNNDTLKFEHDYLKSVSLDEDDATLALKYIERAGIGINLAWRKFNEIRQDLKDPDITQPEVKRLNKEIEVVKQLVGFYDDFSSLYNNYDDEFSNEEIAKFQKSVANWQRIRDGMKETTINLAVAWMHPYAAKHNEYISKEGYTDPKYFVTKDTLYNNFKYGTDKDTNFITYNLGPNVTSRDPVNAIFANIVSDMLSENNIDIVNKALDINDSYNGFLKRTGLNNINNKSQIEFYKKNYLRKASVLENHFNKEKGEYEEVYADKYALHQKYYYDQYAKDLANLYKTYNNPRDTQEADHFNELINRWKLDNNYGQSDKYLNKDYESLQNDEFFKTLEKNYNESNEMYGEEKLQYGLVPQLYNRNVLQRLKDASSGIKTKEGRADLQDKILSDAAGIKNDSRGINLDNTTYRQIKNNLTQHKKDENIDLNLHNSIIEMVTDATNYAGLKDMQYNVENVRTLIEGNREFGIDPRNIGSQDYQKNIRNMADMRAAKRRFSDLNDLKTAGKPYDQELYDKLDAKIAGGIKKANLWDKFAVKIKPSQTNYLNDQLSQFMNDAFYGESVEEAHIGNISLNKAAHYLSMYTSINNMAFNTVAGVSNVVIGDIQMLIEAHGGKYFNKKDLASATADYFKNTMNYISDLKNPIKSKDTQISFILDAIQGEIHDEFGERITGNITRRMFNPGSLFFFTNVGEHQIQTIGMKAMMNHQQVELTDGSKISLYDAYTKDANGRYSLRSDANFSKEDLEHFIRTLHGVNRSLNGNYSDLHKSTLQRKWYGTLALKFRKYLYDAFRSRYAGEHVDFEKNTVDHGYLNFFFKDYLYKNLVNMQGSDKFNFRGNFNKLNANQQYAVRKALMETGLLLGTTLVTMAMFSGGPDKKKNLNTAQKTLLLYSLRLQNDLGMFDTQMFSEATRQMQSPTASMSTIVAFGNVMDQLLRPSEQYKSAGSSYDAGDNKLKVKFMKLLPVISKFPVDVEGKLGYFNMVNQNIVGVSRKSSN